MITFSPFRSKRLNIRLKELSIGDTIFLCRQPPELYEAGVGIILEKIIDLSNKKQHNTIIDPRFMTVQERAMLLCHYIAQTSSDPNFSVGSGKFSDYLVMDKVEVANINLGDVHGDKDKWVLHPMLGMHSESIERLMHGEILHGGRAGWWIGAMAAMLYREKEERNESLNDTELDTEIQKRAEIFSKFPESAFIKLLSAFLAGVEKQTHFFNMTFLDDGIAFLPLKSEDKEVQALPPARFLVSSAISEAAWSLFGIAEGQS